MKKSSISKGGMVTFTYKGRFLTIKIAYKIFLGYTLEVCTSMQGNTLHTTALHSALRFLLIILACCCIWKLVVTCDTEEIVVTPDFKYLGSPNFCCIPTTIIDRARLKCLHYGNLRRQINARTNKFKVPNCTGLAMNLICCDCRRLLLRFRLTYGS